MTPPNTDFPAAVVADIIASGGFGFIAPVATSDPVEVLSDIIDRDSLRPIAPWIYVGSSREGQGSTFEENVTTTELRVDQFTAVVFENITEVVDTLTLQWAELTPEKIRMLLEADSVDVVGDEWAVHGDAFTSRTHYRVALLGRREPGNGRDITNSGGQVRGELFGAVLQNATVSAGQWQVELQRGQMANISVPYKGYPDSETGKVNAFVGETGPAVTAAGS